VPGWDGGDIGVSRLEFLLSLYFTVVA